MINGLIVGVRNLKQHKEVAIVGLLIGWGLYQFTGMLIDKLGPAALSASIRREFSYEVVAAEERSKEYADMKYLPLKQTVDNIDRNVLAIHQNILRLYQDRASDAKMNERQKLKE